MRIGHLNLLFTYLETDRINYLVSFLIDRLTINRLTD